MKQRFSPRIVYDIAERGMNLSSLITFSHHDGHYIYSCTYDSQARPSSTIGLFNPQGFHLYVRDPPPTLSLRLTHSWAPSTDEFLLQESIRMITDDDPTVVALPASKDGQIEGLANTTLVESIGSFQGHIWKAELKTKTEGEANTRLDWYVSSPVKRQSSFISATEEIVAVSCVANTCAFQLRSHEEPFDTRLVFVENLTHVHTQVKQEIMNHTSQSVLVSGHLHETIKNTISWFVMEEVVSLYS